MALNPFFLQGSQSEQRLIQDLLNEQMTIYGVEVTYIPRKILNKDNIFTEVEASEFSDNFSIEAYVNTYEGYSGAGDIMTKFGVSLKDELTVTISKERFEDYIGPFMASIKAVDPNAIEVATRPQEGEDLKNSDIWISIEEGNRTRKMVKIIVQKCKNDRKAHMRYTTSLKELPLVK